MPQCIAVVFAAALDLLGALLAPSKGRHRAVRRRSRRVRPYAPALPAAPAASPGFSRRPAPERSRPRARPPLAPRTPARLNPPTEAVAADEIALVRPYYTAHEHDLAQSRATARLRAWGADLPDPDEAARYRTRAYTLDEYAAAADTFHVPVPRAPLPRMPARVDELPHLSRLRRRQQEHRAGMLT